MGWGGERRAPRGARREALTSSRWAHCGPHPGARSGDGRARGAAATSLKERAAWVMARARQCAGGPLRPGRHSRHPPLPPPPRARLPRPLPGPRGRCRLQPRPARGRRIAPARRWGGTGPPAASLGSEPGARPAPAPPASRTHSVLSFLSPGWWGRVKGDPGESSGRGTLHRSPLPEAGCQDPCGCASPALGGGSGALGFPHTAWLCLS